MGGFINEGFHMSENCWISWNKSRRSAVFAEAIRVNPYIKEIGGGALKRHFLSALWTVILLARLKPRRIYIQYSFFLLIIACLYQRFIEKNAEIVCDCHTKALRRAPSFCYKLFMQLKRWSLKSANFLIVSNKFLVQEAERYNKNILVIPDFLPNFFGVRSPNKAFAANTYVVFPMSYDLDEPLGEIEKTIKALSLSLSVFLTGSPPKNFVEQFDNSKNIIFTGYLPDHLYIELLSDAACIVGLTTEGHCLQSSGYEAIALQVPYVTSNTEALKDFFGNAAVYVEKTSTSIIDGINYALANKERLKENIVALKDYRKICDSENISRLENLNF